MNLPQGSLLQESCVPGGNPSYPSGILRFCFLELPGLSCHSSGIPPIAGGISSCQGSLVLFFASCRDAELWTLPERPALPHESILFLFAGSGSLCSLHIQRGLCHSLSTIINWGGLGHSSFVCQELLT